MTSRARSRIIIAVTPPPSSTSIGRERRTMPKSEKVRRQREQQQQSQFVLTASTRIHIASDDEDLPSDGLETSPSHVIQKRRGAKTAVISSSLKPSHVLIPRFKEITPVNFTTVRSDGLRRSERILDRLDAVESDDSMPARSSRISARKRTPEKRQMREAAAKAAATRKRLARIAEEDDEEDDQEEDSEDESESEDARESEGEEEGDNTNEDSSAESIIIEAQQKRSLRTSREPKRRWSEVFPSKQATSRKRSSDMAVKPSRRNDSSKAKQPPKKILRSSEGVSRNASSRNRSQSNGESVQSKPTSKTSASANAAVKSNAEYAKGGNEKVTVTLSSFDLPKRNRLEQIAASLNFSIASDYKDDFTHVVVPKTDRRQVNSSARRTMKVLAGLAKGAFIVSEAWLEQCAKAKKYVDASKFELRDEFPGALWRRTRAKKKGVLAGLKVMVRGETSPSRADLEALIQMADGKLATSVQDCDLCVGPEHYFRDAIKLRKRFIADMTLLDALQEGRTASQVEVR